MSEPVLTATPVNCCPAAANKAPATPSFTLGGLFPRPRRGAGLTRLVGTHTDHTDAKVASSGGLLLRSLQFAAICLIVILVGCGNEPSAKKSEPAPPPKPAEPAVPDDIQAGAEALLGTGTQVLLFGDLAKTGNQQFLAANVVPKTPKNNLPGTIITRAVIAENHDGQWAEIFRCDEHLKNAKGFLGLTPLASVTGWRIAYEQNPDKGLQLYFTPLKGTDDPHVLPIGVRWNPTTKRYQSLDRTYEHFLVESPTMGGTPRSTLR
jgi:hypothetical protein